MNKYIYSAIAVVIILVSAVVGYTLHSSNSPIKVGGTGEPSEFDNVSLTGGLRQGVIHADTTLPQNQVEGYGIATLVTSGTITRTQSTIITNPFAATSTVTFAKIQGSNGTSTIDILMGTTTQTSSITNNSQVSPTLINATTISTSTQIYSVAGDTVGPGGGYKSPGSGTFTTITVGPSESIGILATSSYSGSSVTGNNGITSATSTFAITYSIEWQK